MTEDDIKTILAEKLSNLLAQPEQIKIKLFTRNDDNPDDFDLVGGCRPSSAILFSIASGFKLRLGFQKYE